jgi:RimJ/RimL family protein N-acetyltransferase
VTRPAVALRPVRDADLPVFFVHQADPDAATMAGFPSRDAAAHLRHWRTILVTSSVFARTVLADGVVAGNVVSWVHDGEREIGYWLGREHWGKGLMTDALSLFLAELPDRPLIAHVAPANRASIRVLEKCGFVPSSEGRRDGELAFRLG